MKTKEELHDLKEEVEEMCKKLGSYANNNNSKHYKENFLWKTRA